MRPLGVALPSPRERFARAHRALKTAAVTGTNGKTTTTSMIAEIVRASGEPQARVTTLGAWVCDEPVAAASPTDEFLVTVERAVDRGVRTLALEVTSKALAGGLARRWRPHVAVFTNLSRDHLDMHASPEAYLAAKAQLFMSLGRGGVAVLNADDPSSALIAELVPAGVRVCRFSTVTEEVELAARAVEATPRGTRVELAPGALADSLGAVLELGVAGAVHAQNALAAALACDALGYPADCIARGLRAFAGVAGRFQIVGEAPLVVVDYAHTPDGLEGTLQTARELVGEGGRLVCVFGCGGDRDRGKRPEMGAIAHALADRVVLTSDNPRHEPPQAIAAAVRAGASGPGAEWREVLDRPRAIDSAVAEAGVADVVVIAGKGHEDVQEVGDRRIPMVDADLARRAHREHHG